jgi:hypothetical protein
MRRNQVLRELKTAHMSACATIYLAVDAEAEDWYVPGFAQLVGELSQKHLRPAVVKRTQNPHRTTSS